MNDNWLKDIHDRMENFETDVPDAVWKGITAKKQKYQKKKSIILWSKRICAAVASVAVIFFCCLFMTKNSITDVNLSSVNVADDNITYTGNDTQAQLPVTTAPKNIINNKVETPHSLACLNHNEKSEICDVNIETKEDTITNNAQKETTVIKKDRLPEYKDDTHVYVNKPTEIKTDKSHKFSLSVFTNGSVGVTKSDNGQAMGLNNVLQSPWNGAGIGNDSVLNIRHTFKSKLPYGKLHHKLPVKAGIKIAFGINNNIDIETGVTYSLLMADKEYDGKENFIKEKQSLHYIGLPINMKYRIYTFGKAELYATAGVLAEKCVSGKYETSTFVKNELENKVSENITIKKLQFSANLSAGLQYNINKTVAAYIEPGMSYYFDNKSETQTYYSEKPCNFNLNFGLKFKLNK